MSDIFVKPRGHCQVQKHLKADTLFDTVCVGSWHFPSTYGKVSNKNNKNLRRSLASVCGGGIEWPFIVCSPLNIAFSCHALPDKGGEHKKILISLLGEIAVASSLIECGCFSRSTCGSNLLVKYEGRLSKYLSNSKT